MKTANRSTSRATNAAAKPASSRSPVAPRGVSSLPPTLGVAPRTRKSKPAAAPDSSRTRSLFDDAPPQAALSQAAPKMPVAAAKKAKVSPAAVPLVSVAAPTIVDTPAKSAAARVSAKKRRAPADLALQYGEREAKRAAVVPVEAAPTRRPRRDAAARAKLKGLIAPDEALLSRLARVDTVSTAAPIVALEDGAEEKPARRSRVQETGCGKCGTAVRFSTPATLCARCGAILLKA